MGKKRHTQDKMWITYKELVSDWGGKSEVESKTPQFKKLPFYCCSLAFTPFQDPVCLADGTIFDIVNILPYIKKHKKNPITGFPLKSTDLIKLNFHTNQESEYHCPITFKVFNDNSYIIAIRETGNVYSYEAYDELNKKPKNFKDLLTDVPFDPKNIIIIQDPKNLNERNIQEFEFVKNKEDIDFIRHDEEFFNKSDNFVNLSSSYKKLLDNYDETNTQEKTRKSEIIRMINDPNKSAKVDELAVKTKSEVQNFENALKDIKVSLSQEQLNDKKLSLTGFKKIFRISPLAYIEYLKKSGIVSHERFTEGKASSSFTSTSLNPYYSNKMRSLSDDEIRQSYYNIVKCKQTKGYVRINTNHGSLNIQLECDLAPKTCENFLELCEAKYYDNLIFHRLIKHFMIQGGDPSGTGRGGQSIFMKPFEDEFHPKLLHKGRGVIAMANSGKNTNGSQFYITFKSANHLDNKHTVFGEVVGGIKILDDFENIETDNDRPKKEILIKNTEVFTNPFRDVIAESLLEKFNESFNKDTNSFEFEKRIEESLKNKKEITNNKQNDLMEVGKYLTKKRNVNQIIGVNNSNDPYLYEKPNNSRKAGEFDFTKW